MSLRDGAVLVPLVAVILFLAFYPQFALHRSEGSLKLAVAPAVLVSRCPSSPYIGCGGLASSSRSSTVRAVSPGAGLGLAQAEIGSK
jgi:hypothetical protein